MINKKKVLGVILARSGSKRLPNKNILPFAGKPLIAWSIQAALSSKTIDKIIVSSENLKIIKIAQEYGAETPFTRPSSLALDKTSSEDSLKHAVDWINQNSLEKYDFLVYLQPTSPLVESKDIDQAISLLVSHPDALSVVSVSAFVKNSSWLKTTNSKGYFKPLIDKSHLKTPIYLPNGAVYVMRWQEFSQTQEIYTPKTLPYIMPVSRSIDIDTKSDFQLAECYKEIIIKGQKT